MASQYALSFSFPEEFPDILKSFSEKILHAINMDKSCGSSRTDIYEFAMKYFAKLAAKKASESTSVLSKDEVNAMARQLFIAADTDESGSLDPEELKSIMTELAGALGFTKQKDVTYVVKSVMDVADIDANGVISYQEFLPVATDIVQVIYAKVTDRKTKERDEMERLVTRIFNAYDTDGSGYLDLGEFTEVFRALAAELQLQGDEYTDRMAAEVMAAVDMNSDNQLSLKEFMPLCVECLRTMIDEDENAKFEASAQAATAMDEYAAAAQEILLNGLTQEELEQTLVDLFKDADLDNSGTLERDEFTKCLLEAEVGITREQVDFLMDDIDTNEDGLVDFMEFAPLAYNLLVEVMAKQLQDEDANAAAAVSAYDQETLSRAQALVDNMSEDELNTTLEVIFSAADADGSGALDREEFRNCLEQADLGLNESLIAVLMEQVDVDADNFVTYKEFAPLCFRILVEVVSKELQVADAEQAAAEEVNEAMLAEAEAYLVNGFNEEELRDLLQSVFEEADADGSKLLDPEEFRDALMLSDLKLSQEEAEQVSAAVDTNGDGQISYEEFLPIAYRILVEITRDEMVEAAVASQQVAMARTNRAEQVLVHNMSEEDLLATLLEIFQSADTDNSGTLDPDEFIRSLRESDVDFTDDEIMMLGAQADVDADGVITFNEFAPLAYDLLVEHIARALDAEDAEAAIEEEARAEAKSMLVHGMSREELETTLRDIFSQHDKDNSGKLDSKEFFECLVQSDLGLADEEIGFLRQKIDTDEDGEIDFDEFAPLCFDLLVEVMTKQLVAA